MKSNRMFYIGIGCLIFTLCWTVFVIAREKQNLSNLEVNRLVCSKMVVLDKDGKEGLVIGDYKFGDGGGSVLRMTVKDNRIFEDGTPSQGELKISSRGLQIDNWSGRRIASIHVERANGVLSLNKRDGNLRNLFYVDTENAKSSKTHCPCHLEE